MVTQPEPRIGLLPLYLRLYDEAMPEVRPRVGEFAGTIADELVRRAIDVTTAPVCRERSEFEAAVGSFERAGVDAIVTLHLAYSPSLESSPALTRTKLPIIVLDTTPSFGYGPKQDPAELMYNHGIHGVQDLCNMLIRGGKAFDIEAGHWQTSDVLDRVAGWARAARAASVMRSARVGLIGTPFEGMGDFQLAEDDLRETIGLRTVPFDFGRLPEFLPSEGEVEREARADRSVFETDGLDEEVHRRSLRAGLAVRRWMEVESLAAFTHNFAQVTRATGFPTVPFLEASKAMARGQGYAGEGDVLTAALVAAIACGVPDVSFTEMFCTDWENDAVFVSHMGEMNPALCDSKAVLIEKPMPWIDAEAPVLAVGRFRGGEAVLVNLAPGPRPSFSLILAPVAMLAIEGADTMQDSIRGWFKPAMPVGDFLAGYSRLGGTHHCALAYGPVCDELARFGRLMGWGVHVLT